MVASFFLVAAGLLIGGLLVSCYNAGRAISDTPPLAISIVKTPQECRAHAIAQSRVSEPSLALSYCETLFETAIKQSENAAWFDWKRGDCEKNYGFNSCKKVNGRSVPKLYGLGLAAGDKSYITLYSSDNTEQILTPNSMPLISRKSKETTVYLDDFSIRRDKGNFLRNIKQTVPLWYQACRGETLMLNALKVQLHPSRINYHFYNRDILSGQGCSTGGRYPKPVDSIQ